MSGYEKLTVVKLRDELVKRGLPKTGLKAALVQRLEEADAQTESEKTEPNEPAKEIQPGLSQKEVVVPPALPLAPVSPQEDAQSGEGAPSKNDALPAPEPKSELGKSPGEARKDKSTEVAVIAAENELETADTTENEEPLAPATVELSEKADISEAPIENSDLRQDSQSDVLPRVLTQPAQDSQTDIPLPTPVQTQYQENTMSSIAGTEEVLEDSRKRKRRSQSPPPSSIDTQKRLKADKGRPRVELPEDTTMQGNELDDQVDRIAALRATPGQDSDVQTDRPVDPKVGSVTPKQNGAGQASAAPSSEYEAHNNSQIKPEESPIKPSPSDTRFKSLFTAPSKPDPSAQQTPYSDTEDRVIDPALHPATSALYVRELMRPLKPENVKDHLAALATPPDAPVDSSIITDFFLDSIRTHCLVGFANISAASRVRSGLHDRIWPDERDRRPLFVDFVPEEKLRDWIDVEQNAPSGRGHPQKRWEVVYEDESGEIKTYLQEVGSNSGGLRAAQPASANASQGVQGAPSGPRIKDSEPRPAQSRPDNAKGFQALDDLFKSTNAKPKLYYQPVPKARAGQRLERLAAGRGGGRNDEMRRYTFEDDALVDRAPEFGNRGRGYGGRGGFSGSYRGRGGGHRGDGYRGGGDSWRDRRPGY